METDILNKTLDYDNKVMVFYEYRLGGITKNKVVCMEKDPENGTWHEVSYDIGEIIDKNPDLAKEIRDWESK